MRRFFGSPGGRLFCMQDEREVSLFRHDIHLWKREIDLPEFTILSLSNKGTLFVMSPHGLYIWPHDPHEPPTLLEHFSSQALARIDMQLGRIQVGAEGTALCAELIGTRHDKSGRILPARGEGDATHEYLFFDILSGRQQPYFKMAVSPRLADARVWALSVDFRWMVFATPGKGSRTALKIVLVDLQDEYPKTDFPFDEPGFRGIYVNRDGTVCIDTFHQGVGRLHVVTRGKVTSTVTPPSAYELTWLARTYVALNLTPIPHMLFKGFNDHLLAHVDLGPLDRLGMEWGLHFDERDDINLLTWRDGVFRVVHTSPERITTDAKRWNHLANSQKLLEVEMDSPGGIYHDGTPEEAPERVAERQKRHKQLSHTLVQSVQDLKRERHIDKAQRKAEIHRQLERAKMAFATGEIDMAEYERLTAELQGKLEPVEKGARPPSADTKKGARPRRLLLPGQGDEGKSV